MYLFLQECVGCDYNVVVLPCALLLLGLIPFCCVCVSHLFSLMGPGAHRRRIDELMDAAMSDMDLMPLFVQVGWGEGDT